MKYTFARILIAILLAYTQGISIPSSWKLCKENDPNMNACLKDSISSALNNLIPGNPDLNIRPLDPLHMKNFTIVLDDSDVKMTFHFTTVDVFNFVKNSRVKSVESDWKTMNVKIDIPEGFDLISKCRITEGSTFMDQPIYGDGSFEIHYGDATMNWRLKFNEKNVGGVIYYNVEHFDFKIDSDKKRFKLSNMYNGDTVKTEKMTKLLNVNSQVFWKALKKGVSTAGGQVGQHSSNKIFSVLPKNVITPP